MSVNELVTLLIALSGAVGGIGSLVLTARKFGYEKKGVEAASAEDVSTAAVQLLKPYQERVHELSLRVTHLEAMCAQFEAVLQGAHKLHGQVKSMGMQPVYNPPEFDILRKP